MALQSLLKGVIIQIMQVVLAIYPAVPQHRPRETSLSWHMALVLMNFRLPSEI